MRAWVPSEQMVLLFGRIVKYHIKWFHMCCFLSLCMHPVVLSLIYILRLNQKNNDFFNHILVGNQFFFN